MELEADGVRRVPSTSISASCSSASCSATPASRGIPAPTTGRSPSATSTATDSSSTASSASGTRPRTCATRSQRGDWDAVGRAIAREWENRKQLAPGVTTPGIDDLIARATRGRCHGREGVRRGRRRVPLLLRAARGARGDTGRTAQREGAPARLHVRAPRAGAWITRRSRRSWARSPTCSRSRATTRSRFARIDRRRTSSPRGPTRSPGWTRSSCAPFPASARTSRANSRAGRDRQPPYHQELLAQFPPTILDLLRLQGVGPKTVAMLYSTLNISTLDGLAAAREGSAALAQGHGRQEGGADSQVNRGAGQGRRPASADGDRRHRGRPGVLSDRPRAGRRVHSGRQPAPGLRNLRRHRHPGRRRRRSADGRVRRAPAVERVLGRGDDQVERES